MLTHEKPINHNIFDKRIKNPGRPKKLTKHDERNIIRPVHYLRIFIGSFTAKRLKTETDILATISVWTNPRVLNRWLPLSTITQKRDVDKQRRLQKIEVCSTNETLITLLLETLRKILVWWNINCWQDQSLWPGKNCKVARMEKTKWRLSSALYIKRQESRS